MALMNVIGMARPNEQQNEELMELWDTCVRLTANSSVFGDYHFPTTIEAYNDLCDNDYGVTQAMLDEFIDDVRYGHRCRLCARTEDVLETGRCIPCQDEVDA